MDWAKTTVRRGEKHLGFGIWCTYIRGLTVVWPEYYGFRTIRDYISLSLEAVGFNDEIIWLLWNLTSALRPGHTALYGLITAKTRQKVVSREADDVVRVDVEFKTSYSRFIDVAGRGEKLERRRTRQKFWTAQNLSPRTTTDGTLGKDVQHTWNTHDNPCPDSD